VDLVDEQHVAVAELGQDGGEVAGPVERRPGGDLEPDLHLGGDDAGQRRLAQAGRPGEEQVVGRLAPAARRLQDDRQVLLQLGLADELVEAPWAEADLVERLLGGQRVGVEQLVAGHVSGPRPGAAAPP
jgi:hypothetical protein